MKLSHFILKGLVRNQKGQNRQYTKFTHGTVENAREKAREYHDFLEKEGFANVRVEIWEVIATDYKGTIR